MLSKVNQKQIQSPIRNRSTSFYYKILDTVQQTLKVDFESVDIDVIIKNIGIDLNIDMFTTAPIKEAGKASIKAESITFDVLLDKIFENTKFTFKKENDYYFFG